MKSIGSYLSEFFDQPSPPATMQELECAQRFRQRLASLNEYSAENENDGVTSKWRVAASQFAAKAAEGDPREFLRWDECWALQPGQGVLPDYLALRMSREWPTRWKLALRDTHVGRPRPFFLYSKVGCSIIQHASHLMRFEKFTGRRVSDMEMILEFGGGFGGMCRLVHQVGFAGVYMILDLKQMSILQSYFLENQRLRLLSFDEVVAGERGIWLVNDVDQVERAMKARLPASANQTMFIATWSFSESPISLRERIVSIVHPAFGNMLITFQTKFDGIDNRAYFDGLRKRLILAYSTRLKTMWLKRPHTDQGRDYYLFAVK